MTTCAVNSGLIIIIVALSNKSGVGCGVGHANNGKMVGPGLDKLGPSQPISNPNGAKAHNPDDSLPFTLFLS